MTEKRAKMMSEAAPNMLMTLEGIVRRYLDTHQATGEKAITLRDEDVMSIYRIVKAAGGSV